MINQKQFDINPSSLSPNLQPPKVKKHWYAWWQYLLLLGLIAIFIVISIGYWAWKSLTLGSSNDTKLVQAITIKDGQTVTQVIDELATKDLITSGYWAKVFARLTKPTFRAGIYYLSPSESVIEIFAKFQSGLVSEKQVTLIEGWRLEQIAERLLSNGLIESYDALYQEIFLSDVYQKLQDRYDLIKGQTLEGFLFPDTYRFSLDQDAAKIVAKMIDTFIAKTQDLSLTYQDLLLASIVEREAKFDQDRALIAGVYKNRLKIGMKLDADPTVQYALATHNNPLCTASLKVSKQAIDTTSCSTVDWWPNITSMDYQAVVSEYNTYRNAGLPPYPIANPGIASIRATIESADHDFLYFLTDSEGYAHFAKTLAEHNKNKVLYLR